MDWFPYDRDFRHKRVKRFITLPELSHLQEVTGMVVYILFSVTRADLGLCHRLLILQQSLLGYQFSKLNSTFFPIGKILLTCYLVLADLLYTAL